MDNKYRTVQIAHGNEHQRVAVYANTDANRSWNRGSGEVIVYITAGGFTCGLHITPGEANKLAELLGLAADEASPVEAAEPTS